MKTYPLILLGVLCDDGFTIKIENQEISVKNGQQILKSTRNEQTGMWKFNLETEQ